MRAAKPILVAALLGALLPLTACTATPDDARVVVKVAPSAHPQRYEVHLAQPKAGFRSVLRIGSGETRAVEVPKGWVTVRVAGLCVVPAPTTGTTTVVVRSDDCTLA